MALPTLQDLKNYCRIDTTAEDGVLTAILAAATAMVTAWLRRPITSASRTYVVEDPRASSLGVSYLSCDPRGGVRTLRIPDAPVASEPAPAVVDANGNTVDATTYRLNTETGELRAVTGYGFGVFPYTITATTGLETRSDYETAVEPALFQGILDVGADLHQRRNPAATEENDGIGGSVRYGRNEEDLPLRARAMLAPFRKPQL